MQDYKAELALLYIKQQDLTDKTPSDLYNMYQEAYAEIAQCEEDDILHTPLSQF